MIQCDGVIVMSSYRHCRDLPKLLQYLGTKVAPRLPLAFYQAFRGLPPFIVRAITKCKRHDVMLCAKMYGNFNKRWFRDQCVMAASWQGCELKVPQLRIHGEIDPVIPKYDRRDVDLLLKGDMHMSSLSRKREVDRAIEQFVERVMRSKTSG